MRTALFWVIIFFSSVCVAGGTEQSVELAQFSQISDTDYVLTVMPLPEQNSHPDRYLSQCQIFVVVGKYRPKGFLETGSLPGLSEHLKAMEYLSTKPSEFRLGAMGGGFHVYDRTNPCTVESRALQILNGNAVYSWYDGT